MTGRIVVGHGIIPCESENMSERGNLKLKFEWSARNKMEWNFPNGNGEKVVVLSLH